jgi:hypothetical protein
MPDPGRLGCLAAKYEPENVFRLAQSILPPAASGA